MTDERLMAALNDMSETYDRVIEAMRREVAYFDGLLRVQQLVREMQEGPAEDSDGTTQQPS